MIIYILFLNTCIIASLVCLPLLPLFSVMTCPSRVSDHFKEMESDFTYFSSLTLQHNIPSKVMLCKRYKIVKPQCTSNCPGMVEWLVCHYFFKVLIWRMKSWCYKSFCNPFSGTVHLYVLQYHHMYVCIICIIICMYYNTIICSTTYTAFSMWLTPTNLYIPLRSFPMTQ